MDYGLCPLNQMEDSFVFVSVLYLVCFLFIGKVVRLGDPQGQSCPFGKFRNHQNLLLLCCSIGPDFLGKAHHFSRKLYGMFITCEEV